MRIPILTLFLLFLTASCAVAQQSNYWYWGNGDGLDFTDPNNPTIIQDGHEMPITHLEGTAVIGDAGGEVKYYTDGVSVWNGDDDLLPNGTGLLGGVSCTQSAIIVPNPANDFQYYLFTTNDLTGVPLTEDTRGLHYSIINDTLNNFNGDIEPDNKNVMLADSVTEKLTYAFHADKQTYWVASRTFGGFNLYRVGPEGLDTVPVFSPSPIELTETDVGITSDFGEMKFSVDGTRFASSFNDFTADTSGVEIYEFDAESGQLSNPRIVGFEKSDLITPLAYGIEFSPSGRYLYYTEFDLSNELNLYQLDVCIDSIQVADSLKTAIHTISASATIITDNIGQMKLGPDGRIYVKKIVDDGTNYVEVIDNPEAPGDEVDYLENEYDFGIIELNGTPLQFVGFSQTYPYKLEISDMVLCDPDPLTITLPPLFSDEENLTIAWSNGQAGASADFPVPEYGEYIVNITNDCQTISDTFMLTPPMVSVVPENAVLCDGETLTLTVNSNVTPISITWNDGTTGPTLTVSDPGEYSAAVELACGIFRDTAMILGPGQGGDILGPDAILCEGDEVVLDLTFLNGTYDWSTGSSDPSITVTEPGTYSVVATDECGTTYEDEVTFFGPPEPVSDFLGDDGFACAEDPVTLDASDVFGTYLWSTGSTESTIEVAEAGLYSVTVTGICDVQSIDEVLLDAITTLSEDDFQYPNAFTPDGDMENDGFLAIANVPINDYQLRVFNRWGREVYNTNDPLAAWDGSYEGEAQPMDVYVYLATGTATVCGQRVAFEKKGDLTLIR